MKRLFTIFYLVLSVVSLIAVGCVEPVLDVESHIKDAISVHFKIRTSDETLVTKSETGLVSGTDAIVSHLYMYCFDENGRYLGRFESTKSDAEDAAFGVNSQGTTPNDNGTFFGKIPPATARIHFVANADIQVGNDKIGLTEEQIFNGQTAEFWNITASKRNQMAYWGYLKCATVEELKSIFSSSTSTTIYLLRDRAEIVPGSFSETVNPNYDPTSVQWTVYNGMSNGYVAPYDKENASFEGYYTVSGTSYEASSVLTPQKNPARDVTDDEDLRPFTSGNSMFLFEDNNDFKEDGSIEEMVRIIVKVKVKNSTQVLYFPVRLTDKEGLHQLHIKRGHRYQLNLGYLPVGLGYPTFEKAAAANSFANGQLVSIPMVVPEVSDGKYTLKIIYELGEEKTTSTNALFNEWPGGNKTVRIPFKLAKNDGTSISASDFSFLAEWANVQTVAEQPDPNSNTSGITLDVSSVPSDGIGYVIVNLNEVGSSLKSGVINLQETKHKLERRIYIYSIDEFVLQNYTLTQTSSSGYRLSFTLPEGANSYPEGLYPLRIKIASKSLRPSAAFNGTTELDDIVFGVEVKSTGTEVPGIVNQTNTNQWNYQNPQWNFWYIFTIDTKSSNPVYNIDFDDIRTSYAQANRPTNVGLYLRIEFFGDAKAVTGTN